MPGGANYCRLPSPAKTVSRTTSARRWRRPAARCRAASRWPSRPPKRPAPVRIRNRAARQPGQPGNRAEGAPGDSEGQSRRAEYSLDKPRTNIGRMAELTDSEHRVVRRNDVVFEDGADPANDTVSRRHAHIRLEDRSTASATMAANSARACSATAAPSRCLPAIAAARGCAREMRSIWAVPPCASRASPPSAQPRVIAEAAVVNFG